MKSRSAILATIFLLLVAASALLAPFIAHFSFDAQDVNRILLSPNKINFFGTDELGRDLFSRILYGARVSLVIAIVSSFFAFVFGVSYGIISGLQSGAGDAAMMRFMEVVQAVPALVLMILLSVVFNSVHFIEDEQWRSVFSMVVALSIVSWVGLARVARQQALQLRELEYVLAAKASGAGFFQIAWRHILPNIMSSVIVSVAYLVPSQILHESFLSFIGLGLQPPYSSWGVLANEGWRSFRTHPHLILVPGVVIFLTMLACQYLGDFLRDKLDPQSQNGTL